MIARASAASSGVTFRVGDVADWSMPADADVVVSNATLQWVPGHRDLLRRWARRAAGRRLARVPGAGQLRRAVARPDARAGRRRRGGRRSSADVLRHHDAVGSPAEYATLLLDAGLRCDVWETTYLHLLHGADPVLDWVRGTGLRPVLAALADPDEPARSSRPSTRRRCARPTRRPARHAVPVPPHLRRRPQAMTITGYDHVQVALPAGGEAAARAFYGAAARG